MCCLERWRERRLAFGFTVDVAQRLDGGWTRGWTLGLATGVGLKGKMTVEVEVERGTWKRLGDRELANSGTKTR